MKLPWWLPFGRVAEIDAQELHARLRGGAPPYLLDVRSPVEWRTSRIAGAVNVPVTELNERLAALGVDQTRRGLDMIRRVASQGIGVVIITHIMQQAFQVADRMVVIRQGVVAGNVATKDTSPDQVIAMITGETLAGAGPAG